MLVKLHQGQQMHDLWLQISQLPRCQLDIPTHEINAKRARRKARRRSQRCNQVLQGYWRSWALWSCAQLPLGCRGVRGSQLKTLQLQFVFRRIQTDAILRLQDLWRDADVRIRASCEYLETQTHAQIWSASDS